MLILRAQAGDGDALDALICLHYDAVYAYCYRHTGQRELAQDLAQDAFVRMLSSIGRYRHYGMFLNYMYVIAGNLCRDWMRKKKPLYSDALEEAAADARDAAEALAVKEAIIGLPFAERNAVILHYYHDRKVKDIARISKSTVAMTKYHLRRAYAKLRLALEEDDHAP